MSTSFGTGTLGADVAAFEMPDEVLGERAQEAGDHPLLLRPEIAAVRVGDGLEPGADELDVALGPDAVGDVVEVRGDLAGPELARRALPARLDVEEPAHHQRHGDHVRGVVVDDEPAGAEAGADRGHGLVRERRVDLRRGEHRVRDARQDRLELAGRAAPRHRSRR